VEPQASTYSPATWRLVVHGAADGAYNMAVDEAIMSAVREETSPPTLRFYAWSPPCLSLGRNQPLADVDLEACQEAGIDVIRRPTGGRAILHTDELTYSVALSQSDPRATGDVVESYRRLGEGLLAGLRMLEVDAIQAVGQQKPARELSAVCFETPSDYEITVGGRKLIGSAQWRARGAVLQHGTLPLRGKIERIVDYLTLAASERVAQRKALGYRAVTLQGVLGQELPFEQVAESLAAGFGQALNVRWEAGQLTDREIDLAASLLDSQYEDPAWLGRR